MTRASSEGDFLTPILRDIIEQDGGATQRSFAQACKRHESWVSQLKDGKAHLYAFELPRFCSFYQTRFPFEELAHRMGLDITELTRTNASTSSLRRHVAQLMADIGRVAVELEDALEDAALSPAESAALATQLQAVVETARAAKARLPKARGAR